tara:strand:- start:110 stop:1090 length:981 start_codon:yes stop_codon:yes gene_type:complete
MSIQKIREIVDNIDYSFNEGKKISIALMTYDRVDYTKRVLDSLEANKITKNIPIFLFIDGGPKSRKQEIVNDLAARDHFIHKFAIPRNGNIGCSANIINARDTIFMDLDFDSAFILEDDLVLAENYIEHLMEANNRLTKKYNNIGMIQGWNKNGDDLNISPDEFELVSDMHLWGYIMNKPVWEDIRDIMIEYRTRFHDHLTKNGNGKWQFEIPENLNKVRKYMKDTLSKAEEILRNEELGILPNQRGEQYPRLTRPSVPTGQDAMTETSLISKGYARLMTSRNKSKNIGEWGLHQTPEIYARHGLANITYSSYDYNPEKFYVRIEK